MNTIDEMVLNHEASLAYIKECQVNEAKPELKAITNFLLETEDNLYGILPQEWAGSIKSACSFRSLLYYIHHALYDDGDISFPIVDGEPRIAFVWEHEDNFKERALKHFIGYDRREMDYDCIVIEFCKDVFDFIEKRKAYFENSIKGYFILDVKINGLDYAVKHYSKYSFFDISWSE